jgi:hypothetical protein
MNCIAMWKLKEYGGNLQKKEENFHVSLWILFWQMKGFYLLSVSIWKVE